MDLKNRRALRQSAAETLAANPGSPSNMAFTYAGILALIALVSTGINLLINWKLGSVGGLSGIRFRSVLSSIQSFLPLVQFVLTMGLGFGYKIAAVRMSRGQRVEPGTLKEGFTYFWPVLRCTLLQGAIFCGISFLAFYLSMQIFLITPLSREFAELVMSVSADVTALSPEVVMDEQSLSLALHSLTPLVILFFVLSAAVSIPVLYRLRMAMFALVDDPGAGAFAAMRNSRAMTRNNCKKLFLLDLGYWWYYLLQILVYVICYADVLLPLVGIALPFSSGVAYFLFYFLSLVLQFCINIFLLNPVQTTYATAYNCLKEAAVPKPPLTD